MTRTPKSPLRLALGAALVLTAAALPAHADWVFKFGNHSDVEAKGVVQGVQVIWLKRGQVTDIRAKGNWTVRSCFGGMCPSELKHEYTVNFEHLSNASIQYCVWHVRREITPSRNEHWGYVAVFTELKHEAPGYKCEFGGEKTAKYHTSGGEGLGITQNFTFKKK